MYLPTNGLPVFGLCGRRAPCMVGLNVVGVIPAAAGVESFITSFGQDEQNNQTGLLKMFVPATE